MSKYVIKDYNGDTLERCDDAHAVLEFLVGTELFVDAIEEDETGGEATYNVLTSEA